MYFSSITLRMIIPFAQDCPSLHMFLEEDFDNF
jgi:hypothetical protein